MLHGIRVIVYPVKDIAKAKALYTKFLGVEPYADAPYYVGYKVGDQEIGLTPMGNAPAAGPTVNWFVDDIKQSLQSLLDGGWQTQQAVRDVGGGMLVASVKDPDGNILGLVQNP